MKKKIVIIILVLLVAVFILLGLLVSSRVSNENYKQDQRDFPYFLGKGCDQYYEATENELRERIEKELRVISRDRMEKLIERSIKEYVSNDNAKDDYLQCNNVRKRVLNILDDVKE